MDELPLKDIKIREEITFILKHYQVPTFPYRELHRLQRVTSSLAEWPLLKETLEPLMRRVQAARLGEV